MRRTLKKYIKKRPGRTRRYAGFFKLRSGFSYRNSRLIRLLFRRRPGDVLFFKFYPTLYFNTHARFTYRNSRAFFTNWFTRSCRTTYPSYLPRFVLRKNHRIPARLSTHTDARLLHAGSVLKGGTFWGRCVICWKTSTMFFEKLLAFSFGSRTFFSTLGNNRSVRAVQSLQNVIIPFRNVRRYFVTSGVVSSPGGRSSG